MELRLSDGFVSDRLTAASAGRTSGSGILGFVVVGIVVVSDHLARCRHDEHRRPAVSASSFSWRSLYPSYGAHGEALPGPRQDRQSFAAADRPALVSATPASTRCSALRRDFVRRSELSAESSSARVLSRRRSLAVVAIWFLVELGILRGTVGQNQYGPDPRRPVARALTAAAGTRMRIGSAASHGGPVRPCAPSASIRCSRSSSGRRGGSAALEYRARRRPRSYAHRSRGPLLRARCASSTHPAVALWRFVVGLPLIVAMFCAGRQALPRHRAAGLVRAPPVRAGRRLGLADRARLHSRQSAARTSTAPAPRFRPGLTLAAKQAGYTAAP